MKSFNEVLDKINLDKFRDEIVICQKEKNFMNLTNAYFFEEIFYKVLQANKSLCTANTNFKLYSRFLIKKNLANYFFISLTNKDKDNKQFILLSFKFLYANVNSAADFFAEDRQLSFKFYSPIEACLFLIQKFNDYIDLCVFTSMKNFDYEQFKDKIKDKFCISSINKKSDIFVLKQKVINENSKTNNKNYFK